MAINTYFKNIADAIREKTGGSALITPGQMPQAIRDIVSSGDFEEVTPLATDFKDGYNTRNGFTYSVNSNYRSNVYYLNTPYNSGFFVYVGNTRNRAIINGYTQNPLTLTSNISGYIYANNATSNQPFYGGWNAIYNPPRYIMVTKTNNSVDNIPCKLYIYKGDLTQ